MIKVNPKNNDIYKTTDDLSAWLCEDDQKISGATKEIDILKRFKHKKGNGSQKKEKEVDKLLAILSDEEKIKIYPIFRFYSNQIKGEMNDQRVRNHR